MSQPPPYGSLNASNPDKRQLPHGWIEQYDNNYKAWFYVNTLDQPPRPSWTHPLGPPPPNSPPPSQYSPPSGPPPLNNNSPQYGGYGSPQGNYFNPPGAYGGGYGGSYGGPQGSGGYQQEWQQPQPGRGWFGGGSQQANYQQPPKKSGMGMGMGGMVAAGGVGLLGGALLAHEFEEHDDREREEGYDQGYQDGQDNDYGGGDDFGGGDF